jgi:hypothetical protein
VDARLPVAASGAHTFQGEQEMPYTYLPQMSYLTVNGGMIEFIHEGKLLMSMTPEEARSNAADLLDAAARAEGERP